MNVKLLVFHLGQAIQDNPSIAVLAGCCVAAVVFFALMVLPRHWRRWKRRVREKRRRQDAAERVGAVNG